MLELLYIVLFLFTVVMFFTSVVNMFKLERESRTLVMFVTAVLFMILMWASFNVEEKYCVYTTDFVCTTIQVQEFVMAMICLLFMVITILYLIMDFLGKIPQAQGKM